MVARGVMQQLEASARFSFATVTAEMRRCLSDDLPVSIGMDDALDDEAVR